MKPKLIFDVFDSNDHAFGQIIICYQNMAYYLLQRYSPESTRTAGRISTVYSPASPPYNPLVDILCNILSCFSPLRDMTYEAVSPANKTNDFSSHYASNHLSCEAPEAYMLSDQPQGDKTENKSELQNLVKKRATPRTFKSKGKQFSAQVCCKTDVRLVRPNVTRVGNVFRRGPACLSKKEIERLVLLGDKVDKMRRRRKNKQEELKDLYVKLRKGFKEYVNFEETARNNNDIWPEPALMSNGFKAKYNACRERIKRGPARLSKKEKERLVLLGDTVDKMRWRRIKKQEELKDLYIKLCKGFKEYVNFVETARNNNDILPGPALLSAIGARRDDMSRGYPHPMYPMCIKENLTKSAWPSLQFTYAFLLHFIK